MSVTITQRPLIDDDGNWSVHGREGVYSILDFGTEDVHAAPLFFEVAGKFRKPLAAGPLPTQRVVILTLADIAQISAKGFQFAVIDESRVVDNVVIPNVIYEGTISLRGYTGAPPSEANP